jgi:choline dehydrogenase
VRCTATTVRPATRAVGDRSQVTRLCGRRWSTADAHLRPAMEPENLVVQTGALATKVVIEDGRAAGVR